MLGNTKNQPSKFRTKYWIETNDDSSGTYKTNSQIKFKTLMLKSSLPDYKDEYILASGTMPVATVPSPAVYTNNSDKEVITKSCASFTDWQHTNR